MNSNFSFSVYQLKPHFQRCLRTLVDQSHRWGITPNQITVSALGLSFLTGAAITVWHTQIGIFLAVPVVLLLRMALNAMDGMLARYYQMQSPLGAILNELGDVAADVALYLPFATLPFVPAWLIGLIVIGALGTELVGNVAVQIGASRRYDGPMGKSDRALVFSLYAIMIQVAPSPTLLTLGAMAVLCLLGLTIFNRARQALQEVQL